jgi:hypothetical protein
MHHPAAGATRRCPVQPSTPLGPDQVNVLSLFLECSAGYASPPRFLRENCSEIQNDPELAAAVPVGLAIASQLPHKFQLEVVTTFLKPDPML